MQVIDRAFVRGLMPARDQGGHKGTFGKVYLLGGSVGYTGAPVLCAGAAVLCSVWLDESSLIPRYAEFSQNGNVVLTVRMISFACTTGDTEA